MIDIEKLKRASLNISVDGLCNSQCRKDLIEEAIKQIQTNPEHCFENEYLGFKNYAGFGDQRCDCEYGMGPKHGSIVFEIDRTERARMQHTKMGEDEIYLLLVARDNPDGFGEFDFRDMGRRKRSIVNFIRFVAETELAKKEIDEILANRNVELS